MTRWGVTLPFHGVPLFQQAERVRECQDLGYADFWSSEVAGLDAFSPLLAAAPGVDRARLGTAIAGVYTRGPALLAMQAAGLAEAAPGRAVVGLGASSPLVVEGWNGGRLEAPVARLRDTLRFLRRALAGERIDEAFGTFAVRGFRLERVPATPPLLFLGALREGMLRLAGAEADGVLLGLLAPQDVPRVLAVAREARGPEAPALEVGLRIGVYPGEEDERSERAIRRLLAAYLGAPPYGPFHAWLGRGEALAPLVEAWSQGDRRAALARVPDTLVDTLFVRGSLARCRDALARFAESGVTAPILQVNVPGGDPMPALRALAPAATGL